ncbi:hypothetical protein FB45DRAFT_724308, partial [Roridomyces roridus]
NGKNVVVKWNWASKTRTAECAFVLGARSLAKTERPCMLHHLPDVLYAGEMESSALPDIFGGEIASNNSEERVLRVTVQGRLKPL